MRRLPIFLLNIFLLGFYFSTILANSKEIAFVNPPSVKKEGPKYLISFSLNQKTDIEVSILNALGKVVNHIAAGALGDNPPKPLSKGLSQSFYWDGKTDKGEKAMGGPFSVRVRVGRQSKFDGFILDVPEATPFVTNIAVGPKGEIYLWHLDQTANRNQGSHKLKVLSSNGVGNYLSIHRIEHL